MTTLEDKIRDGIRTYIEEHDEENPPVEENGIDEDCLLEAIMEEVREYFGKILL